MYQKTVLPNGLRVISEEMPYARSVSTSFFVNAGSRHEAEGEHGIAHFIEHMLFKGTEKRPTSREVSEAIEGIGGVFNAETGKELAVYWNKVASHHWKTALEVLSDLLLHSRFEPEDVEKERKVIDEELSSLFDSPSEWVHLLADQVIWGEDALGRDVGGTRESVAALRRDQMISYFHTHYVPANTVVVVAGAVIHDEVVEQVGQALGQWEAGPTTRWEDSCFGWDGPKVELRDKRTEQSHFCLTAPAFSYFDPDRYALDLMNIMLGEGMSSRLFLEIREVKGLAYDVQSYINHFRDTGSVVVYAGVDPSRIDEAISASIAEIEKLRLDGVTEDELARSKEYWKGRTLLRLEDTHAISSWLGSQELLLDRVYDVDDIVTKVDSVTAEDVRAVANRVFGPSRLSIAVIGPYRSQRRFLKRLV